VAYHESVSLASYLSILRQRWMTIVAVALVVFLATAAYSFTVTPRYEAHTSVFFSVKVSDSAGARNRGFAYQQTQVRTYAQLAVLPIVLNPVIKKLNLATTPAELAEHVVAQAPLNTPIVQIITSASSKTRAVALADAIAGQLSTAVTALAPKVDTGATTVQATRLDSATANSSPVVPRTKLNLEVAIVLGLLLGAVAAVAADAGATRRIRRRQLEALGGVTVIGTLTMRGSGVQVDGVTHDTKWAGDLRRLQMRLFPPLGRRPYTSVAITSGSDPAFSARLAVGLASTQARAQRVLLIDANVHDPTLATVLGLPASPGLVGVLQGHVPLDAAVQRWGSRGLDVLSAGAKPANSAALLDSTATRALLKTAAGRYDLVLINAAPFTQADGLLMSRLADRAVVVLGRDDTRGRLTEAFGALETVQAQVLGLVLTT
jgi:polysaccharide biosynthesis transport protein